MKKIWLVLIIGFILGLAAIFYCDYRINVTTENLVFDTVETVPPKRSGLLLGTSKNLGDGRPNRYFQNRIKAAAQLYHAGKLKYIIVSGDHSTENYNEPLDMKNALVKAGLPDSVIYLDYAGLRTFDSVVRADKIFGQQDFIIISQKFHNQRAIYVARQQNIKAIGFNAEDVDAFNGFKTKLREKLARVKVFVDALFQTEPKYLGDPIKIG